MREQSVREQRVREQSVTDERVRDHLKRTVRQQKTVRPEKAVTKKAQRESRS